MHPPGAYFFLFPPFFLFSLVPFFPFSHSTPFPFVPLALVPLVCSLSPTVRPLLSSARRLPFSLAPCPSVLFPPCSRPLAVCPFPLPPCFPLFPLLTQTKRAKPPFFSFSFPPCPSALFPFPTFSPTHSPLPFLSPFPFLSAISHTTPPPTQTNYQKLTLTAPYINIYII